MVPWRSFSEQASLRLWSEDTELSLRRSQPGSKNWSKKAAERLRARQDGVDLLVTMNQINKNFRALLNFFTN